MENNIPNLIDVAKECRQIVTAAVADLGPDLQGSSVIDLCCDNLTVNVSIADIKSALVVAGVDSLLSARLVRSYSRQV